MKKGNKLFVILLILTLCFCHGLYAGGQSDKFDAGEYYQSSEAFAEPQAFRDITAVQLVSEIKIGWNLGNTLDAHPNGETSWGNPRTTKANIDAIKEAGFNAIRIPVTWYQAVNPKYEIRKAWMDRVTTVVNYAVENDMYIILNTHHDEQIFKFTEKQKEKSLIAFEKIWAQIAHNFRNYNEKLIFEGLNEPRTKGSAREWSGGTAPEHKIINEYYEVFVKTVRASGGNNDKRIIMVNTYAGSAEQHAIDGLVVPADTVPNKIIVSIHAYSPYEFALKTGAGSISTWNADSWADTEPVRTPFDRAYEAFVSKGIPVILGEFGAMNRNNEKTRAEWAEYYVGYGRSKGIPCIWWDNGVTSGSGELFGLLNRRTNQIIYPVLLEGLMKGAVKQ